MVGTPDKTVLVVDDEPIVLSVTQRILQTAGFKVITAADGLEALQLCLRREVAIDLLVTDINMPRVNGPELVRSLSKSLPNMPVIFMTGFDPNADLIRNLLAEPKLHGHPLLQKPFKPIELVAQVTKLLEA